jgi:hypothetical protein
MLYAKTIFFLTYSSELPKTALHSTKDVARDPLPKGALQGRSSSSALETRKSLPSSPGSDQAGTPPIPDQALHMVLHP